MLGGTQKKRCWNRKLHKTYPPPRPILPPPLIFYTGVEVKLHTWYFTTTTTLCKKTTQFSNSEKLSGTHQVGVLKISPDMKLQQKNLQTGPTCYFTTQPRLKSTNASRKKSLQKKLKFEIQQKTSPYKRFDILPPAFFPPKQNKSNSLNWNWKNLQTNDLSHEKKPL